MLQQTLQVVVLMGIEIGKGFLLHGSGMLLSTLLLWLALYGFVLWCYLATLRHLAKKPSASLLASPQDYPGLLPAPEV